MKRMLVITVLAVLLLSTVGASVAVAKDRQPAGNSGIYQYSKDIDQAGRGKLVVNTKQLTYTFEARGCEPGTMYYLYYEDAGKRVGIASAAADTYGHLVITGAYGTDVTYDQLVAAKVTATPPFKAVLYAWTEWNPIARTKMLYANPWSSIGAQSFKLEVLKGSQLQMGAQDNWPLDPQNTPPTAFYWWGWQPGDTLTVKLTIYDQPDLTGQTDVVTQDVIWPGNA